MEYHSVYLFFNLLYLKYQIEGDISVNLDDLRNAFYEYEYCINKMNNVHQQLDFDRELEIMISDFGDIFEVFDEEITFVDAEPSLLYEMIPELLEDEVTAIDIFMEDALVNDSIYQALNLNVPIDEMQNLFNINNLILHLYKLMADFDLKHKDTKIVRKLALFHKNNLKEYFNDLDNITYMKIKICLAYYNDKYLSDKVLPNINADWHIALMANSKLLNSLAYSKIFYYIDRERETSTEVKSEDLGNLKDTYYLDDEVEYFLTNYILYLNNYIEKIEDREIKKYLLQRKYLLLATGLLETIEDDFLESGSLDNIDLPIYNKEWFTPDSFSFLIVSFEEILSNIRVLDKNLTKEVESQIVINLMLLKTYLELSINENIKRELEADILNPEYYKNSLYNTYSKLVDNILYCDNELVRKKLKC